MQLPWDSKSSTVRSGKMEMRPRSSDLYHTYYWTRLSKAFREEHPLCEACRKKGIIKAADVVDHITPYPICGDNGFFDRDNLQSLCQQCNIAKGNQDKKAIQEWKRTHQESA